MQAVLGAAPALPRPAHGSQPSCSSPLPCTCAWRASRQAALAPHAARPSRGPPAQQSACRVLERQGQRASALARSLEAEDASATTQPRDDDVGLR